MSLSPVTETVVDEWVQQGKMFTAHDVTLEIRNRGHRAGHGEVKDAVHDYYNRGGLGIDYDRSVITTPTGNPWLYHRVVDDPQTYNNIRGTVAASNPASPIDPLALQPVNSSNNGNQAVAIPQNLLNNLNGRTNQTNKAGCTTNRVVDARETLSIPTFVVRGVGFHCGETVSVSAATFKDASGHDENVLDICQGVNPAGGRARTLGSYTVDSHNQIRVTQGVLRKAGLAGNKYDIEQMASHIRVKLSK